MGVTGVNAVTARVVPIPEKLQKAIGEEATRELVDLINQVAATVGSTKLDKAEYDAHAALIEEKFRRYEELLSEKFARHEERMAQHEARTESMIRGALLKGLAWVTVLILGLFGTLWASLPR